MLAKVYTLSAYRLGHKQEEILQNLEVKFHELENSHPDLVVLPEDVLISGGDNANPNHKRNNEEIIKLSREFACQLGTYVAVGVEEPSLHYSDKYYNSVMLFDRIGNLKATYQKRHITYRAVNGIPGDSLVVTDTDIGRIGFMICFDIGWRDDWRRLSDMGAEIVIWPSAYHGGYLLNGYAALYGYYIVSSVWNAPSRIIDQFGRDIASSSQWDAFAKALIATGGEIFHFDRQENAVGKLCREYGDNLYISVEPNGNMFYIAPRQNTPTIAEIKANFGLVSYNDYHAEATQMNRIISVKYPELRQ